MRLLPGLALLLTLPHVAPADDWRPLFNGKDLSGWRANNDPDSFRVTDGVIRVQAVKTAAHLFYVGDKKGKGEVEKFKNFELELLAKAEPESNSGVYFHADMTTKNAQKHLETGYEVQLNSTAKEKRKTGSLYAVVDRGQSPVDETKWFKVRVVVRDKRVTVAIDGKELVDYTEPKDVKRPPDRAGRLIRAEGGGIALQAHDPKSVWYFKDIRVKRLP